MIGHNVNIFKSCMECPNLFSEDLEKKHLFGREMKATNNSPEFGPQGVKRPKLPRTF